MWKGSIKGMFSKPIDEKEIMEYLDGKDTKVKDLEIIDEGDEESSSTDEETTDEETTDDEDDEESKNENKKTSKNNIPDAKIRKTIGESKSTTTIRKQRSLNRNKQVRDKLKRLIKGQKNLKREFAS